MLHSNFLYSKTYELIYKPHRYFKLDIDIGSKVVPYILESKYYVFLSRKLVEAEIKNGGLIEIPISNWKMPPVQNFVIRPFWFNTPPLAAAQEIHRFHKKLVVELPCTACSVCRRHTEQRQAATRLVYTNEPPLK